MHKDVNIIHISKLNYVQNFQISKEQIISSFC